MSLSTWQLSFSCWALHWCWWLPVKPFGWPFIWTLPVRAHWRVWASGSWRIFSILAYIIVIVISGVTVFVVTVSIQEIRILSTTPSTAALRVWEVVPSRDALIVSVGGAARLWEVINAATSLPSPVVTVLYLTTVPTSKSSFTVLATTVVSAAAASIGAIGQRLEVLAMVQLVLPVRLRTVLPCLRCQVWSRGRCSQIVSQIRVTLCHLMLDEIFQCAGANNAPWISWHIQQLIFYISEVFHVGNIWLCYCRVWGDSAGHHRLCYPIWVTRLLSGCWCCCWLLGLWNFLTCAWESALGVLLLLLQRQNKDKCRR